MCNQAAFIGKQPDINKLKILYILGRSRGRDSCGFAVNGEITHGYFEKKGADFSDSVDHVQEIGFPTEYNTPIILHNRAKTIGAATKSNAHPFFFKDGDKPGMYFMHNGSLREYYQLAKKYNISTKDYDIDSQLLGMLLYDHGYDILTEYQGAASVSFYYDNDPEHLYVWKGASLKTYNNKEYLSDERPYHYVFIPGEGFYFASLEEHLKVITNHNEDLVIKEVPQNTVCKFSKTELVEEIKIDRKVKEYTYQQSNNAYRRNSSNYNYNTYNNNTYNNNTTKTIREVRPQGPIYNEVYYYNGKYYINQEWCHGILNINENNIVEKEKPGLTEKFYFYRGYWIRDVHTYRHLLAYQLNTVYINQMHSNAVAITNDNEYFVGNRKAFDEDIEERFMHYKLTISPEKTLVKSSLIIYTDRLKITKRQLWETESQDTLDENTYKVAVYNTYHNTDFYKIENCLAHFESTYGKELDESNWEEFEEHIDKELTLFNIAHETTFTDRAEANIWFKKKYDSYYKNEWPKVIQTANNE